MRTHDATDVVAALQDALAGEHAAIYAYEVIGGRLDAGTKPQQQALSAYRHHRAQRDTLVARVRAAGSTPVTAEPAYRLPTSVTGTPGARKVAVHVEQRCTTLYAQIVATTNGRDRRHALEAMRWCAEQLLAWGGSSSALPGVGRR